MKQQRGFATCYDKLAVYFESTIQLAVIGHGGTDFRNTVLVATIRIVLWEGVEHGTAESARARKS